MLNDVQEGVFQYLGDDAGEVGAKGRHPGGEPPPVGHCFLPRQRVRLPRVAQQVKHLPRADSHARAQHAAAPSHERDTKAGTHTKSGTPQHSMPPHRHTRGTQKRENTQRILEMTPSSHKTMKTK